MTMVRIAGLIFTMLALFWAVVLAAARLDAPPTVRRLDTPVVATHGDQALPQIRPLAPSV